MTEEEWLGSNDSDTLLKTLVGIGQPDRLAQLFGVACCRRIWDRLSDAARRVVELIEHVLDEGDRDRREELRAKIQVTLNEWVGKAGKADRAVLKLEDRFHSYRYILSWLQTLEALSRVSRLARQAVAKPGTVAWEEEAAVQAVLFRDIFSYYGRPMLLPSWLTSTVVALAQQVYDCRDFSPMPILADALQDAGCDNEDILNHCRGPGPHCRGCWLVDFILLKDR